MLIVTKKRPILRTMIFISTVGLLGVYSVSSFSQEQVPVAIPQSMKDEYRRPANIPFPQDNPYSKAKAKLGKTLFFETRISRSGVMSCATCHNPGFSWTDGNARGTGDFHKILPRKDPATLNLAWDELFFWDGRAEGLEKQSVIPIQSEGEMHMPLNQVVARLKSIHEYKFLFETAFPHESDPVTIDNVAKAISTFERTIVSGEAPFDRWVKGDENAISSRAKQGFLLFNTKANCASCHSGWRFSDDSFHDIGINDDDIGRGKFLPVTAMQHAFKTMGLRNIDRRSPYMHNGSMDTLTDVVEHYDHGFVKRASLADEIRPLNLTEQEKKDLVEFLHTLSSNDAPVTIPVMPK